MYIYILKILVFRYLSCFHINIEINIFVTNDNDILGWIPVSQIAGSKNMNTKAFAP